MTEYCINVFCEDFKTCNGKKMTKCMQKEERESLKKAKATLKKLGETVKWHWQCRKHGEGCQSYVAGIVIPSLNEKKITQ